MLSIKTYNYVLKCLVLFCIKTREQNYLIPFLGKYAYIETSSPRVQGDNARLVKSGLSFNTKKCLSFYYHMYGTTMGTLNVYVGQKKIFTKSGNQGNQWKKATVDITEPGASEVRKILSNLYVLRQS